MRFSFFLFSVVLTQSITPDCSQLTQLCNSAPGLAGASNNTQTNGQPIDCNQLTQLCNLAGPNGLNNLLGSLTNDSVDSAKLVSVLCYTFLLLQ